MYNRFFSFGCSWTKWFWPTWADIVARDLNIEHQNWGSAGSGNQGIQSRFVEANNIHQFSNTDLIVVQWSGWNREDRYLNGWKFGGNVFNNSFYDKKFIKRYWSLDNDLIKNSVALQMTNDAYKHLINYQFTFDLPYNRVNIKNKDYNNMFNNNHITDKTKYIIENYYSYIPNLDVPKINNSEFKSNCIDGHPDVLAHLDIVETYIYPKLFNNDKVKKDTRDFFYSYYDDLSSLLSLSDSWNDMEKKSFEINKKYNLKLGDHVGI
jgi:hypothetical protein